MFVMRMLTTPIRLPPTCSLPLFLNSMFHRTFLQLDVPRYLSPQKHLLCAPRMGDLSKLKAAVYRSTEPNADGEGDPTAMVEMNLILQVHGCVSSSACHFPPMFLISQAIVINASARSPIFATRYTTKHDKCPRSMLHDLI